MTAPRGTSGNEPVTAPGIHDKPPSKPPTLDSRWVKGVANAGMFRIGATILYWIAGVEVLGGNPFGFLRGWADDLADRANDAYNGAINAQISADDAGSTAANAMQEINAIKAQLSAGDGVYYSEDLNYPDAATLSAPYVLYTSGPGGGSYGPNGNSELAWKPGFGPSYRSNIYRHPDFHITGSKFGCAMVITKQPGEIIATNRPRVFLGAADASGNGVAMSLSNNRVALVTLAAGVPSSDISPVSRAPSNGDNYEFYFGTSTDPDEATIKRNGQVVWSSSSTGISLSSNVYLMVGGEGIAYGFGQSGCSRIGSFTFFESDL
ncbi:MAG: hypothetical protein WBB07_17665 [Mycobacterium sp.]